VSLIGFDLNQAFGIGTTGTNMPQKDVNVRIVLSKNDEQISVSAYISCPNPRILNWRLSAFARTAGGTSNTLQSGTVLSMSAEPVVRLHLNRKAEGEVVFEVYEDGLKVASQRLFLQDSGLAPTETARQKP
jgi:hypothetical protein